jgi:RNA recognition motif-containing protein
MSQKKEDDSALTKSSKPPPSTTSTSEPGTSTSEPGTSADKSKRTQEDIEEELRLKESRSRALVLEAIGDLPSADMKPPENVLFVCKLNPVTTAEDLGIIFSRFGRIKSTEIIKDRKTGESLCYGFIEFESKDACEQAYLKMQNVVIDDRRIHVDFSQSVAKLWNRHYSAGHKRKKGVHGSREYVTTSKERPKKKSKYRH